MKPEYFELDDLDRANIDEVRQAIRGFIDHGETLEDSALTEDETVDGLRLLLRIVDAGYAA